MLYQTWKDILRQSVLTSEKRQLVNTYKMQQVLCIYPGVKRNF